MQNFPGICRSENPNKRKTSILAVLHFENLSKEMFFDLISSVILEKRLSFVFIGMQFLSAVTAWRLM